MAVKVERRTIDVVPDRERHGTPRDQFTLWFGANMQITAIVDGALAVVFGADALWAIIGLLIGNICGGIVMALHSAQGPVQRRDKSADLTAISPGLTSG